MNTLATFLLDDSLELIMKNVKCVDINKRSIDYILNDDSVIEITNAGKRTALSE